jgi:hypothetical protein
LRNHIWLLVLLPILILVVVPWYAGHRTTDYGMDARLWAQLHSISTALELHANEFDGYPPSEANDPTGAPYCGAMKLCEAVLGQDLQGIH